MSSTAPRRPTNFFNRCWTGSAPLWQAFWLVGVLGKLLLVAFVTVFVFVIWHGPDDDALSLAIFVPLMVGFLVYACVSIWRCAPNAPHAIWGVLARAVVIVEVVVWILAAWQEL